MSQRLGETYQSVLNVLKCALWNSGKASVDPEVFLELKHHAVSTLPAGVLSSLTMPDAMRAAWQREIYQQISYNVNYRHEQAALPVSVPYVILKGTSAAKYYPHPEYRSMGDIDIMPQRKDFAAACEELLQNGYLENTDEVTRKFGRHRQFRKNGIEIEVHSFFAIQNNQEQAELLDQLILDHIGSSHELPDDINGLVLLDHISYHMEEGLGLKQIIDWMMYVNRCLPDEMWPSFQELARRTGHEQLAVITTRMCEIYLGLSEHRFCAHADPAVCEQFMEYILQCGNFGRKQKADEDSMVSKNFLTSARTVKGTVLFLQKRGLINWKAAKKYPILRPFAWLHQAFRYLRKGLRRKGNMEKLKAEHEVALRRDQLFEALGVTREGKGIVRYQDGKYVK